MEISSKLKSISVLHPNTSRQAEYHVSGVKVVNLGITPTGKSILSDVETLLSQYEHRDMIEQEFQDVLQDIARRILARSIG